MPGKLLKDLPTLVGGLSGSVIVPVSQDVETLKSSTVQSIRTIPNGNTISFVDGEGNRHAYIDGPIYQDGADKQVRMFIDLGDNKNAGFFLSSWSPHKNKPLYYDGSVGYPLIYLKEAYVDGNNWYRVYSDGWIEQGGQCSAADDATVTITFHKPFTNTSYHVLSGIVEAQLGAGNFRYISFSNFTTTTMNVAGQSNCGGSCRGFWYACGY